MTGISWRFFNWYLMVNQLDNWVVLWVFGIKPTILTNHSNHLKRGYVPLYLFVTSWDCHVCQEGSLTHFRGEIIHRRR